VPVRGIELDVLAREQCFLTAELVPELLVSGSAIDDAIGFNPHPLQHHARGRQLVDAHEFSPQCICFHEGEVLSAQETARALNAFRCGLCAVHVPTLTPLELMAEACRSPDPGSNHWFSFGQNRTPS
jgi:hypothetical protein